jgi:hypothetical protein
VRERCALACCSGDCRQAREKPDFLIASAALAPGGAGEDVSVLTLHAPPAMMAACVMVNRRD